MKPEAWYDANGNFRPATTRRRADGLRPGERPARLRSRAGVAQPDPGLVLPGRGGRAARHRRAAHQQMLRDRLRDAHLRVAEYLSRRATACSAAAPTRCTRSTSSTRWSATAVSSPTACAAASGTASSARVHRPRVPVRGRGVQRRLRRRGRRPRSPCSSTTTTPSRAASRTATRRSSSGCSRAACRSTASATSSTSAWRCRSQPSRTRIVAFEDLPVTQAVTELDVTTGTPVTQANLIEQGYYYRDAFRIFREHADDLFAVTVWGLTDGRSLAGRQRRAAASSTTRCKAKPAYYGAVDGELPARLRTANVFAGDVPLDAGATAIARVDASCRCTRSRTWREFQLRWAPDHLTALRHGRRRDDGCRATASTFALGDAVYDGRPRRHRATSTAVVDRARRRLRPRRPPAADGRGGGRHAHLRRAGRRTAATTVGWNTPGVRRHPHARRGAVLPRDRRGGAAPVVDGAIDDGWADAGAVHHRQAGRRAPTARSPTVRTLWRDQTLYVLAEVADPVVDVSGSDPWTQDSVEIYVDAGQRQERLLPLRRHADPDQRRQRRLVRHR